MRVAILFGGRSAEHEVSIRSAANVASALDTEKYDVLFVGITREGKWVPDCPPRMLSGFEQATAIQTTALTGTGPFTLTTNSSVAVAQTYTAELPSGIDVVFPVLHGPYGEDGSVQGFAKVLGVPCVGAGVLGSAIGMDKDVMKRLLRDSRIPTPDFLVQGNSVRIRPYAEVVRVLGSPFFVKPANLGSSVGVFKVTSEAEYKHSFDQAFQFDNKIILEKSITGREIECAVLGNEDPIASVPGEIIVQSDFYSYDAKYIDAGSSRLEIPANLDSATAEAIQRLAIKTFRILCCEGMARVDFFLSEDGQILVNEINTIPGFTDISMYPKLWEYSGVPVSKLLDRLIELAMERFDREQKLRTSVGS